MNRTQQILLITLIIQVAVAAFVYFPRQAVMPAGPLLSDYKADDIVQITLENAQKDSLTLKKDKLEWKLVLKDGELYPLQGEKVKEALEKLANIKTDRLVTKTSNSHKQLKVAEQDFVNRIVLETGAGKKSIIFLGNQTGSETLHLRLEGTNEVYLTSEIDSNLFSATASTWIDTAYLKIASQDDITAFSFKNAQANFTFEKDASDQWSMKELVQQPLDIEKLKPLLGHLSNMQMEAPLSSKDLPAYLMSSPLAEVTYSVKENDAVNKYTFTIGAKENPEANAYVVKSSSSKWYAKVDGFFVQEFINSTKDDFIKKEPTPTP